MNIKAKLKMNFFIKKEGNSNKKYPNWCMCFNLKNSILSMYVLGLYQQAICGKSKQKNLPSLLIFHCFKVV